MEFWSIGVLRYVRIGPRDCEVGGAEGAVDRASGETKVEPERENNLSTALFLLRPRFPEPRRTGRAGLHIGIILG